jgi:hypothetical protein
MSKVRNRGTTMAIGTKAANHLTDTYTEVEGTVTVTGNIGVKWPEGDITTLKDQFKKTGKIGPADAGRCTLTGHLDEVAASGPLPGLAALFAAALDDTVDGVYNVKLTKSNGRVKYLKAGIFEFTETYGNNQALNGFQSIAILQQLPSDAAPPAVLPANSRLPAIAGLAVEGGTLTAVPGIWSGSPTLAYQWQIDDAGWENIVGATNPTYSPVVGDVGSAIRVIETATNGAGSASANSAPTVDVVAA